MIYIYIIYIYMIYIYIYDIYIYMIYIYIYTWYIYTWRIIESSRDAEVWTFVYRGKWDKTWLKSVQTNRETKRYSTKKLDLNKDKVQYPKSNDVRPLPRYLIATYLRTPPPDKPTYWNHQPVHCLLYPYHPRYIIEIYNLPIIHYYVTANPLYTQIYIYTYNYIYTIYIYVYMCTH